MRLRFGSPRTSGSLSHRSLLLCEGAVARIRARARSDPRSQAMLSNEPLPTAMLLAIVGLLLVVSVDDEALASPRLGRRDTLRPCVVDAY